MFVNLFIGVSMSHIYNRLFIGSQFQARDKNWLQANNITHIVNCASEVYNFHEGLFQYIRLDMEDDEEQAKTLTSILEPIQQRIEEILKNENNAILIHCSMGVSRSATVLIYCLMKKKNWDYERTIKFVRNSYSPAKPNKYFEAFLRSI